MADVKENLAARRAHAAHALSGQVMSGAEIIIQVLADEGVETVFGYSGGAILPTYDAIFVYNQASAAAGRKPMPLVNRWTLCFGSSTRTRVSRSKTLR